MQAASSDSREGAIHLTINSCGKPYFDLPAAGKLSLDTGL